MWLARAVVKVTVDAAHWSSLTSARRDLHEPSMCRCTAVATVKAGEMFGANLRGSQGICWNRNLGTAGPPGLVVGNWSDQRRLHNQNLRFP